MFAFIKKWLGWQAGSNQTNHSVSVRDITLDELKQAISQFVHEKPKGVPLRVLVGDNNEIDYSFLLPYLEGIPRRSYFMSKETYELFEDRQIAEQVDSIQRAVDDYVDDEGKLPILENDFLKKVNYHKLRPYLRIEPTVETFLTAEENLITTKEPNIH